MFSRRKTNRRRMNVESLESRRLMAADAMGVVRYSAAAGLQQWLLDADADTSHEMDRNFGLQNHAPIAGDWSGNGSDFPGAVEPAGDGLLHWYLDTDGEPLYEIHWAFGFATDTPVTGDWDGNGTDNVGGVRAGADGFLHWYLDTDGDPTHEIHRIFGLNGDIPVVGDWDGNGHDDVGVVRPNNGYLYWYLDKNGDAVVEETVLFGLSGDRPMPGDWNGDGRTDMGIVRAQSGDSLLNWYLDTDRDPSHEIHHRYGFKSDTPVAGNWRFSEIEVRHGGRGIPNGGTIDLGDVFVGDSKSTTISVYNTGTMNLTTTGLSVSNVKLQNGLNSAIGPNGYDNVQFAVEPTRAGVHTGTISFNTNDGNESPFTIHVRANGVIPPVSDITVRVDGTNLTDGRNTVTFPDAEEGSSGPIKTFTVINDGLATLDLNRIEVTGNFRVDAGFSLSQLAANRSATFMIRMNTTTVANQNGTLRIYSNDPDESPFDISLAGRVRERRVSDIRVMAGSSELQDGQSAPLSFPEVTEGDTPPSVTLTVVNDGLANLTLNSASTTGPFEVSGFTASQLSPNQSTTFTVRMLTTTFGSKLGSLRIGSNDPDEGTFDIPLRGLVNQNLESDISVSVRGVELTDGQTDPVRFDNALVGDSARLSFQVKNLGVTALDLNAIQIEGDFQLRTDVTTDSLATNQAVSFDVAMSTAVAGEKSGIIRILSSDSDESPFDIPLSGQVVGNVIPPLHSNPDATTSLYLDFDGHIEERWGNYENVETPPYDIDNDPTTFSTNETDRIKQIWERVAEDFAPFEIDVTTVNPGDFSDRVALRVAIGGDGDWFGRAGGVAYVNSFTNVIPNTVFVFSEHSPNHAQFVADASSHEAGHAFGLHHQSRYDDDGNRIDEYHPGTATWAPLMGVSYNAKRSTWHRGTSTTPTTIQDDMRIIGSSYNGFGLRQDDHGNTFESATPLLLSTPIPRVVGSGIIETTVDRDAFSINVLPFQSEPVELTVQGKPGVTNLDLIVEVYNGDAHILDHILDPENSFGADVVLDQPGTYTLIVRSNGEYGSVGQYTIGERTVSVDESLPPVFLPVGADLIGDGISPRIESIRVSSTDWSNSFLQRVDPDKQSGFVVSQGDTQLDSLPWGNLNTIAIEFSENVPGMTVDDVRLVGMNTTAYEITEFHYDPLTHVATFSLTTAIGVDRLQLEVTENVQDRSGNGLDGEWTDGVSQMSGDGIPGGKFLFSMNVVPGDTNRSGAVAINDLGLLRSGLGAAINDGSYSIFADTNGSGAIAVNDIATLRQNLGNALPRVAAAVPDFDAIASADLAFAKMDGEAFDFDSDDLLDALAVGRQNDLGELGPPEQLVAKLRSRGLVAESTVWRP